MKRVLIVLLPIFVSANSIKSIFNAIDSSPRVRSAKSLSKASYESYLSSIGDKSIRIDLQYSASYSKEYPTMKINLPPMPPVNAHVAQKKHFVGELRVSYPIFSGYAISSNISKAKWRYIESKLRVKDLRRNLYLKAVESFSQLDAIKSQTAALKKAKSALYSGYKKAKAMYSSGLIGQSDLFRIKAQLFNIDANIANLNAQKKALLNMLTYISGTKVGNIKGHLRVKRVPSTSKLIAIAFNSRSDLLALEAQTMQKSATLNLAKSQNYPQISALASLKKEGDNWKLDKNLHSNSNKSFVALQLKWNLYNGGKTIHQIEAAKYAKIASKLEYNAYRDLIKMEIKNAKSELNGAYSMLKSAKIELKAQKSYYNLSLGKYKNALISADEFANAIANWANAKANYQSIKSKIATLKAKLWLLAGLDGFKRALR